MDWEEYRNSDGSIDLMRAFNDMACQNSNLTSAANGYKYVLDIITLQPISSRQLSAVILIDAIRLSK